MCLLSPQEHGIDGARLFGVHCGARLRAGQLQSPAAATGTLAHLMHFSSFFFRFIMPPPRWHIHSILEQRCGLPTRTRCTTVHYHRTGALCRDANVSNARSNNANDDQSLPIRPPVCPLPTRPPQCHSFHPLKAIFPDFLVRMRFSWQMLITLRGARAGVSRRRHGMASVVLFSFSHAITFSTFFLNDSKKRTGKRRRPTKSTVRGFTRVVFRPDNFFLSSPFGELVPFSFSC